MYETDYRIVVVIFFTIILCKNCQKPKWPVISVGFNKGRLQKTQFENKNLIAIGRTPVEY